MLKEGRYILLFYPDPDSGYYVDTGTNIDFSKKPVITLEKGKIIKVEQKAFIGGTALIKIKKRDGTRFIPPSDKTLILNGYGEKVGFVPLPDEPDETGNYLAKALPPDIYWFSAEIEGHAVRKLENIKIEKGKTTEIEFIIDFSDPTGIEGRVISSIDGGPISGADISVSKIINKDRIRISPLRMETDETGYFSIVGLSQGLYIIYYSTPFKISPHVVKSMEVYVNQGKKSWVELKLDIPSNVEKKLAILQPDNNSVFSFITDGGERLEGLPKGLKEILDCSQPKNKPLEGTLFENLKQAIKTAINQALTTNCLPPNIKKNFERSLRKRRFIIRLGCPSQECGRALPGFPIIIDLYGNPWARQNPEVCGCIESLIFHELLHLSMANECRTYACAKQCFPCAKNIPEEDQFGNKCKKVKCCDE